MFKWSTPVVVRMKNQNVYEKAQDGDIDAASEDDIFGVAEDCKKKNKRSKNTIENAEEVDKWLNKNKDIHLRRKMDV